MTNIETILANHTHDLANIKNTLEQIKAHLGIQ